MPQLLGRIYSRKHPAKNKFCPEYDTVYASKNFSTENLLAILRGYTLAPHIPLTEYSTTIYVPSKHEAWVEAEIGQQLSFGAKCT